MASPTFDRTRAQELYPELARLYPGLTRYVEKKIRPGGFVRAVLENDLSSALSWADSENRDRLSEVVGMIQDCVPAGIQGSREVVWLHLNQDKVNAAVSAMLVEMEAKVEGGEALPPEVWAEAAMRTAAEAWVGVDSTDLDSVLTIRAFIDAVKREVSQVQQ